MPLHDWSTLDGWDGMHAVWIVALFHHVKARLPAGYRAYLGSTPGVAVGSPRVHADLNVRSLNYEYEPPREAAQSSHADLDPDFEVAISTIQTLPSLYVERNGWLVAVVELVSPRNKDRESARERYSLRYSAYLLDGANLMLVDVHGRPGTFSFVEAIEDLVEIPKQPSLAPPAAASYRVGEPAATGGRYLAVWRRQLTVGQPLPELPLPLTPLQSITVDLEATYMDAAADVYLT